MCKIGVSVDLIIRKNNKILLGKLSKKWRTEKHEWGLPGRDVSFGETFQATIERDVKRELGMKLKNFRIISVNNNFWLSNHYVNIGVLVETEGIERLRNENDWEEWKWFDIKELPKELNPPAEKTSRSFLENKTSVSE
jgi:ADP-ribose pyrophosphatase YjhB (NUDIX family)